MPGPTAERGAAAELQARRHLERHGLKTLATNFRSRWGELDIVMEQGRQIVFVEVRYRASKAFGGATASVTAMKRARLVKAASQFLEQQGLAHRPARFDIVAIHGTAHAGDEIEWLPDAFAADD